MTLPDTVCPKCGSDYTFYPRPDRLQRRCLPCQRVRQAKTHWDDTRCRRGHLKTPWTWTPKGDGFHCLTCRRQADRRRALTARARLLP